MEKEVLEPNSGFPLDISAEDSVKFIVDILNQGLSIDYLIGSIDRKNSDFKKFIDGFIKRCSETDEDRYAYIDGFVFSYNIIRLVLHNKGRSMPDVDNIRINAFLGSLVDDKRLFNAKQGETEPCMTPFIIWQNSNVAIKDGGFFNLMYSLGLLVENDIYELPNFMQTAILTYQLFSYLDDMQNTEDQFM